MSCGCQNQHQKSVVIRNPKSGLVLDASEDHVKVQHYSGCPAQQWTLHCVDGGRFVILNVGNGKALDIQGGVKIHAKLITYPKHARTNQQWHINGDGTIECPCDRLVLDILHAKYCAGNHIIAFPKHGKENQVFKIESC